MKTKPKNQTASSLKEISQVQRDIYLDLFKKIEKETSRKIRQLRISFGSPYDIGGEKIATHIDFLDAVIEIPD